MNTGNSCGQYRVVGLKKVFGAASADAAGGLSLSRAHVYTPGAQSSYNELSALSSFHRSAERFAPMSQNEQSAAVAEYQKIIKKVEKLKKSGDPSNIAKAAELDREANRLLEHVCASCWKLAWVIVKENAEKRFGKDKAADMLADLMGEANIALIKAAKEYSPEKTPVFHTYAARVVRDHVRAVVGKDTYIKLAPSWGRIKRMASEAQRELEHKLGRKPTIEEIQCDLTERCMRWAYNRLTDEQKTYPGPVKRNLAEAKLRKQGMLGAIRDLKDILVIGQNMTSLDSPIGEDGGGTVGDSVGDDRATHGDQLLLQDELNQSVHSALGTLAEREREILKLRYGFGGDEPWTYAALATKLHISSERVRQIERVALGKLASSGNKFGSLHDYLQS